MPLSQQLLEYAGSGKIVRITRKSGSDPRLTGYIVSWTLPVSDGVPQAGLVLVHAFHDFLPDGYALLPSSTIADVLRTPNGALWDLMLKSEDLLSGLETEPPINTSSLAAALVSIASNYRFLIIQCEAPDDNEMDFYLGEVIRVEAGAVEFRTLNSMARWDDEPHTIPLADITLIAFDTEYLRRFTRYIGA